MRCASTGCASWRNVARSLSRSDHHGLLSSAELADDRDCDDLDDDELLAELGRRMRTPHPTSPNCAMSAPSADKRAAEEIANRKKCEDFDRLQAAVRASAEGTRERHPADTTIRVEGGNPAREAGSSSGGRRPMSPRRARCSPMPKAAPTRRLRVIFDNGTESNLLMRSLQRALNKDEAGRRITDPVAGPLFSGQPGEADQASGTIYVLRSKSDHPFVAANRDAHPQDRRHQHEHPATHCWSAASADISHGRRRDRRDLSSFTTSAERGWKISSIASLIQRGSTSRSRTASAIRSFRANGSLFRFS